jgi:hypothetical protein
MRPRGTAVRFELVDQIDAEEPTAAMPRAVTAWERYMREVEQVTADASRQKEKSSRFAMPQLEDWGCSSIA